MGWCNPLNLVVEILQPLNEAEELGNSGQVAPSRGEKVQRDKGKRAKVANYLVHGWDGGKVDPHGHLQGVCQCHVPLQLLR